MDKALLPDIDNKYYCSQKFWWLTIDLARMQTASCCEANFEKIDIDWVKDNPGEIFNQQHMIEERFISLKNISNTSCEKACWSKEAEGSISRRILMQSNVKTHTSIYNYPEVLNLIVGTNCNMTCVYCCKNYSTAWTKDIMDKTYDIDIEDSRFTLTSKDKILYNISQKKIKRSSMYQTLLNEIQNQINLPSLKKIIISGGEPFLYLDLELLVSSIPEKIDLEIYTGLGVDENRFKKEIEKLPKNTTIIISAENIGKNYEFIRYGNSWQRLLNNIELIKTAGINFKFMSTVSNLTVFGLKDFIQYFSNVPILFQACVNPNFLSVNVLDNESKQLVRSYLNKFPEFVSKQLDVEPTNEQINNLKKYCKEFSMRRNLNLNIFPKSFVKWIES